MKRIHYFSGITIALFLGIHILNHLMILHSAELHISFMQLARKIYRNPIVESILLLAVGFQIISGIALVRKRWSTLDTFFDRMHILSGLYMALFLIIHVSAVLMGRYQFQFDTNLWYGAGVMNLWPHKVFFIPYYTLALMSFFAHIACVHRKKMEAFTTARSAMIQSCLILFTGVVLNSLIILKMSNLDLPEGFH